MTQIEELRRRIEESKSSTGREYVRALLADPDLDHVSSANGEDLPHVTRFVEGRIMSSSVTGHELPGAQDLFRALQALPSDQLIDRFALWKPDVVCIVCFISSSTDLIGIMISHREPGRPSFTSKT